MMFSSELSRAVLEGLDPKEREIVLAEAGRTLTERLRQAADFDNEINEIVRTLSELGHNLRLFDINFDVDLEKSQSSQVWCGDWTGSASSSSPLVISFHSVKGVELEWSDQSGSTET